jgi:hypothetical protein
VLNKFLKFLSSLKLAVIIITSLSILTAVGTFVEAEYDLEAAGKLVYKTPWMYAIMGALAINLSMVMVDRWPWKRKHVPFLLAHIGILILLLGSLITFKWGLDGTMIFGIGESNRYVRIPNSELTIWSSFDGDRYTKVFYEKVDFFLNSPKDHPVKAEINGGKFEVLDYVPYAVPQKAVQESTDKTAGAALRFQMHGSRASSSEWLVQKRPGELVSYQLGPAKIHFGFINKNSKGENEIYLQPTDKGIEYALFYKDEAKKPLKGYLKEGDLLKTGWMDFDFRVLRFYAKAEEKWDIKKLERPTPNTSAAIRVIFMDKEHWIFQNDLVKLFTPAGVNIISYAHERIDIGFDLRLIKFNMDKYQGTQRAMSYESLVEVPGKGEVLISMNEPLKHEGLTFYQASFQTDPNTGEPNASILSVNYDPGRWVKYLGSLILSLGVIWLFYDKRRAAAAAAAAAMRKSP